MSTISPQRLPVHNDHDLITLRQVVRQQARAALLGASQQARFTAAVSEFARLLLREGHASTFTICVATTESGRLALEVSCAALASDPDSEVLRALTASPALASARSLVDDMRLLEIDHGSLLAIRMWLAS